MIGQSEGIVQLYDVETCQIIHSFQEKSGITNLVWGSEQTIVDSSGFSITNQTEMILSKLPKPTPFER